MRLKETNLGAGGRWGLAAISRRRASTTVPEGFGKAASSPAKSGAIGRGRRRVFEALRHQKVVHTRGDERKQGIAQDLLWREPRSPGLRGAVAPHEGFGIETDDAERERVDDLVVEGMQGAQ